ncbi:isoleucine--tRNA ligase [Erythrobacter sp. HI0063]|jgi:isoleucyl-tRNA synthetase|uniref:isoleucine--tRNA ligase n=1 Tax=Erythrobacter sp. HI0063 TaxID=1822240 RepID=UPI0007C218C8|nr:isoleucine--tRNA ligase [Erythrobacter sp. HI0063]KZY55415.1 isoleucine--tRNA ligase [Erythrobacter sp. HI0063]
MSDADPQQSEQRDYRDTVFLPKTDFPMKAGLPQKEPGILARWQDENLYEKLRDTRRGADKFILHDGPPYANGDMHIGHALNRILKDMVVRTQGMMGKDAPFVPGWDCHGLPIEWKVEEQYRKKKRDKDDVPRAEFRAECRDYAAKWVEVQKGQLERLGLMADFANPYLTMQFESEATIVAELMKFVEAGNLYRGAKPVMWSPVEKTALAEAEVEYEDITSTQIDVAFEIVESPIEELVGAHAVIWTTTPWTIPVNQALAYGPEIEYRRVQFWASHDSGQSSDFLDESELWFCGNNESSPSFLVADALKNEVADRLTKIARGKFPDRGITIGAVHPDDDRVIKGSDLAGTKVRHPMHKLGGFYETLRPMLPGDFVTTDSGTGLVHMAPDHGEDDFDLCKTVSIEPVFAVMDDGRYRDDWPWLGASDVDADGKERRRAVINPNFNAPDGPICSDLRDAGAVLSASQDYQHSYPHSWRSKAKVIYRCTPQWFVPMDRPLEGLAPRKVDKEQRWEGEGGAVDPADEQTSEHTLRSLALNAIGDTQFVPERGRNRIRSMVEGRPDWVLSRQRAWGVPITLFVRADGSYLQDADVNARVVAAVGKEGVDAWREERKAEFLGPDHNPDDYEMVTDILDVWFDSGCTHAFTLDGTRWPDQRWPADLYLEGSDQHRGWFQSSLLESCATRGRAPYDAVLTHGFTMASDGRKMSKSLGNTIDPLKVMEQYGADIIRLWALSVDYTEDHRIGDEILKGVGDQYRRLRNTFRYLLGALAGYDESEAVVPEDMPQLERYILARLKQVDGALREAATGYDFDRYVRTLVDFCNEDLSAFYFDIRKDRLYCDAPDGMERRAYRTVLDTLFHALVRYAAPVLVFTSEEVWGTRFPDAGSIHLETWRDLPDWRDEGLSERFGTLRELREDVMEAIEPLRREKIVRSGLEADVTVPAERVPEGFSDADLAEAFITASVTRSDSADVTASRSSEDKCGRCWRLLPSVAEDGALCDRCEAVVAELDAEGVSS